MIENFVAELDQSLRGPKRVKRRLLDEAAAGLADAAEAYHDAGWDKKAAAARAVADFGPVPEIAPAFQAELDVARARRTAVATVLSMPLLAVLWNDVWESDPYLRWNDLPGLPLMLGIAAAIVAIGTSVAAAAALVMTGRLGRYWTWPAVPRDVRLFARTGSSAFGVACAMVAIGSPHAIRWLPIIPSALLTVAVLSFVATLGRQRLPS